MKRYEWLGCESSHHRTVRLSSCILHDPRRATGTNPAPGWGHIVRHAFLRLRAALHHRMLCLLADDVDSCPGRARLRKCQSTTQHKGRKRPRTSALSALFGMTTSPPARPVCVMSCQFSKDIGWNPRQPLMRPCAQGRPVHRQGFPLHLHRLQHAAADLADPRADDARGHRAPGHAGEPAWPGLVHATGHAELFDHGLPCRLPLVLARSEEMKPVRRGVCPSS